MRVHLAKREIIAREFGGDDEACVFEVGCSGLIGGLRGFDAAAPAAEKIRRRRSIAIALTLGFMVLAFYVATFVRLGGNVVNGIG